MDYHCSVEIYDTARMKNKNGAVSTHPLNEPYGVSYGNLAFAGDKLAESSILDDIRVFFIMFWNDPPMNLETGYVYRGTWADPLRIDVLLRLMPKCYAWYLGFRGNMPDSDDPSSWITIEEDIRRGVAQTENLPFTVVQSAKPVSIGRGQHSKIILETPRHFVQTIYERYWPNATPGTPIEGYLMPEGNIEVFKDWDQRARDDLLFRDVMDRAYVAFSGHDDYNDHLIVYTNKITVEELREAIDLEELSNRAYKSIHRVDF